MEQNDLSLSRPSTLHYSSEIHPYVSEFTDICLLLTIKFEYMENISRRTAIKTFLAGGVALATTGIEAVAAAKKEADARGPLKGNVPPLRK